MRSIFVTWSRFSQPFAKIFAAFLGLVAISVLLNDKRSQHLPLMGGNLLDFYPETRGDGSKLLWNHAVNSRTHLDAALKSKSHMLEADVTESSSDPGTPIMAHPPLTESDITLVEWLSMIVKKNTRQGIKLDISSVDILEPTLTILKQYESQIKVPLVLDADILPGPGNPLTSPLNARIFMERCKQSFPTSILSLGWTTYVDSSIVDPKYDDKMIADMKKVVIDSGVTQPITFAVRACIAKNSVAGLQDLLRTFPGSTLTVWSRPGDPVTSKDVLQFRSVFNLRSVYYDLPSPLKEEFLEGIDIA